MCYEFVSLTEILTMSIEDSLNNLLASKNFKDV